MRGHTRKGTGGQFAAEPLGPQVSSGKPCKGGSASGSHNLIMLK